MFQQASSKRARIGQPCSRCQFVDTMPPNCLAPVNAKKAFYCITGVRSVLRQLRHQLFESLRERGVQFTRASMDEAVRDEQLIAFFAEDIHAGVDTDGIEQHRSAILTILRFFLDLKESRPAQDFNREYAVSSTSAFANLSKRKILSLKGIKLLPKFVQYLLRVHAKPMLQVFGDELYKCRSQSFEAIINLTLI